MSFRLSVITSVATASAAVALVSGSAPAAAAVPSPPPVQERNASTVTSDVLPTAQIDSGVVWSTAVVGNTVYAGGSFSNARPAGAAAGTNLVPRGNALAFDIRTGVLSTTFAPSINGQVKVVRASPDGTRVYVGGSFTSVNGTTHYNLVAFSTATGQVLSTFKAQVGGSYVNAIAATDTTVFVGGLIGAGNGVIRKNLAAFDVNGKLLGWAPTTDLQVDAMVMTPANDKVIVGGRFSTVNGQPQRGLVALSPTTGSIVPWAATSTVVNGNTTGKAGIYSLSADANAIYGTGWVQGGLANGNLEGTFAANPATGAIIWIEDCHGDTYSSYSDGVNVYAVNHAHDCSSLGAMPQRGPAPGNLRHAEVFTAAPQGTLARSDVVNASYKDWSGYPAPAMINWFPDFVTGQATGQGQAAWTLAGNGQYVVAGGEFPYVNGALQQGLVRFARPGTAGTSKDAPRLAGNTWGPRVVSLAAGTARISIPLNYDRDNLSLTYKVVRSGTSTPVYTKAISSPFWDQQPVIFTDTGLTPGQTYTYYVTATDGDGNVRQSSSRAVTVTASTLAPYPTAVLADGAAHYWRFSGAPGTTTVTDVGSYNDVVESAGVTNGTAGALLNEANPAATFNGTSSGSASTRIGELGPNVFTISAWFKTTTTAGGKIVGFGSSTTGLSNAVDRHVYMDNSGRLIFGVVDPTARTIISAGHYNNGAWHQVVATLSASGMALYVDGSPVGTNAAGTKGQTYYGFWRIGGDKLSGWPATPSSSYFSGVIDEVAVYPVALAAAQVQSEYHASGR